MKKRILAALFSLASLAAVGQPVDAWVNNLVLQCPPNDPPQINARNVTNNAVLLINNLALNSTVGLSYSYLFSPFETANTVNFANYGTLSSFSGFRFENFNTQTARYGAANTFYNESGATINCGGILLGGGFYRTNAVYFLSSGYGAECLVKATNVISHGAIEMGPNSDLYLHGRDVDLSGGSINMEGFESSTTDLYLNALFAGYFDGFWGVGQDNYDPSMYFGSTFGGSPSTWATNRYYATLRTSVSASTPYLGVTVLGPSNTLNQVVYLANSVPGMSNNIYFIGENIAVEWTWPATNVVTGLTTQESMYLYDEMMMITNLVVSTNGSGPYSIGQNYTYAPTNLYFFRYTGGFFGRNPATPGLPAGFFPGGKTNINYAIYEALFVPFSEIPYEVGGMTYSNMPGHMEIRATNSLDLTDARIGALNYLSITATNGFRMDNSTRIMTPIADYDLGSTSGSLTVSNLLAPTCPRPNGSIDVYSAIWTNIDASNITNIYHVLVVNSALSGTTPSSLQYLTLHSPNVYISDNLNVLSNLFVDAVNLTITANGPDAAVPYGQLNFTSGNILWTNSFPKLQALTNNGNITVANAAYFGGLRYPPFYPSTAVEPYLHFVNSGSMSNQGCFVWSRDFQNTGVIDSGFGSISVQATSAQLTGGQCSAPYADVKLYANDLLLQGVDLVAGRNISLWATNSLDDGGIGSGNFWNTGVGGFNLLAMPRVGNLLGTTVTNSCPASGRASSTWAARDLGATAAGYSNNVGVGHLILDGGQSSRFIFGPANGSNALYVDLLELRNWATNRDGSGNLSAVQINSGLKIYYAQAIMNGASVAEKLNHKYGFSGAAGGTLNWVPSYAGAFSSTNVLYPDGTVHTLNTALVTSANLDSNNNGIPNNIDPTPVFVDSQLLFTATQTNRPAPTTRLTWQTIGNATNTVYFKPSLTATNWQVLTNFVSGPVNGLATVLDPMTSTNRYYRVEVDLRQP